MKLRRRNFLASLPALGLSGAAQSRTGRPIDIGVRRQLFIDRKFIERDRAIELQVNPPCKAESVIRSDQLWDRESIGHFSSVIEHEGICKLWYVARSDGGRLCLAESEDGVEWRKPALNAVAFGGSRANNIVLEDFIGQGSVMLDPVAPPAERFKTMAKYNQLGSQGKTTEGGAMLLVSPDGIGWTHEYLVLPFKADSPNCLFWDARIGKYAAYLRGWAPLRVVVRCEIDRDAILGPWPYKHGEEPFYLWRRFPGRDHWPPAIRSELPVVLATDRDDAPDCDIYTSNAQPYAWADSVYFAFPSVFRHTAPPGSEKMPMEGRVDVHCAVSRDGIHWTRPGRPYLALGMDADTDSRQIYFTNGMIRRGDRIFHYYCALPYGHGQRQRGGVLMRAEQRLDGFLSAQAGFSGGAFETPLLLHQGEQLALNVDSSATGSVSVGLLDSAGRPIPGYGLADCDPILTNATAHPVAWRGSRQLPELSGTPLRLKFELRNARIFAFQFMK